jgi:hypothetical protein
MRFREQVEQQALLHRREPRDSLDLAQSHG